MTAIRHDHSSLHDLSAAELLAGYARRTFSPVEVMRAILERTARLNAKLNAFFYLDPDGALTAARASEARWMRRDTLGLLDGVPISIKDSIAVAGMPMYRGAAPFRNRKPSTAHSPPAARVLESGAICFGKTTMPDFGIMGAGVSSAYGTTRNPWNLSLNTGGSTSGGASAVAARLGPLTIGTDLGGSVRLPAALCGLATIKPTQGLIPHLPPSTMRSAGPIARNVKDVALLLRVLTRPDPRDYGALPAGGETYQDLDLPNLKGWRIGVVETMGFGAKAEAPILEALRRSAANFASAGASVMDVGPLLDFDPTDAFLRIFGARAAHEAAPLTAEERKQIHPGVHPLFDAAKSLTADELLAAGDRIESAKASVIERTGPYDIILSPATPVIGFPADQASPDPDQPFSIVTYTAMFNQTGQPAAVVCGGFSDDGVPFGIQIAGRRHDDLRVMQAAAFCESALNLKFDWPL